MSLWVFTCEHGGNDIPSEYHSLFKPHKELLNTHRGIDFGALDLWSEACKKLKPDFQISSTTSRLLVELNRSLHHPKLFSSICNSLPNNEKEEILKTYYHPYRDSVEKFIAKNISKHVVFHVSFHSFTPVMDGVERNADIGLLYDSALINERMFCANWREELNQINPDYRVRMNYPYLGKADGFTTYLRRKFGRNYIGIELEVNQKFAKKNVFDTSMKNLIIRSIESLKNN